MVFVPKNTCPTLSEPETTCEAMTEMYGQVLINCLLEVGRVRHGSPRPRREGSRSARAPPCRSEPLRAGSRCSWPCWAPPARSSPQPSPVPAVSGEQVPAPQPSHRGIYFDQFNSPPRNFFHGIGWGLIPAKKTFSSKRKPFPNTAVHMVVKIGQDIFPFLASSQDSLSQYRLQPFLLVFPTKQILIIY